MLCAISDAHYRPILARPCWLAGTKSFLPGLAQRGGTGGPVRAFSLSGGPVQNISPVLTESFWWSVQGRLQHGGGCQWFGGHSVWKMAKPLLNYICDAIADILWCSQWKLSWVCWSVWACCYRIQVGKIWDVASNAQIMLKHLHQIDNSPKTPFLLASAW